MDRPFAETLRGDECLNSQDSIVNPRCRVPFKAVYKGVIDLTKLPDKTDKFWFQAAHPHPRKAPPSSTLQTWNVLLHCRSSPTPPTSSSRGTGIRRPT